uniref:Uncharacterized protein n=1 Tax=Tanacetum cinerariifolium TaxID=118510 RepID=A0A699K7R6_TANCI|nr:hypothetical protein [Tanacetum cinerariifolium]
MADEDPFAEVTVRPKFDTPCHESTMSPKDVKSLALWHGIPLDLHPYASCEGKTMDQLPDEVIVNRGIGFLLRREWERVLEAKCFERPFLR